MKASRYSYSFKEFSQHFCALPLVGKYSEVQLDYSITKSPLHIGQSNCFEAQILRVMDYMAQVIEDREERTYKGIRLHSAMTYLSRHINDFEHKGLAYRETDEGKPSWVSEPVLKALHKALCGSRPPTQPQIKRVIALAEKFKKAEVE